jgi:hypothetical protein
MSELASPNQKKLELGGWGHRPKPELEDAPRELELRNVTGDSRPPGD